MSEKNTCAIKTPTVPKNYILIQNSINNIYMCMFFISSHSCTTPTRHMCIPVYSVQEA